MVCALGPVKRRLYSGNPSTSVRVSLASFLGKLLKHVPMHFGLSMHGQLTLCAPHGPWIIYLVTALYRAGSVTLSGISALIMRLIWAGMRALSSLSFKINKMCTCGSERF